MIVAVLGKIASGKSEIMTILQNKGFYCIYGDKITRALYENGKSGQKKIKKYFGEKFLTQSGDVDREKLRNVVFNSPAKLKLLNTIIHPLVYVELKSMIRKVKKNTDIVLEVPFLDGSELHNVVNKIIWIERSSKLIERTLISERGFSKILAKKVVKLIKRPKEVDFVIKNDGDFSALNFLVSQALDL